MNATANDINAKQDTPESISLLKAADAAYMYARQSDYLRVVITLASVGGAILATVRTDLAEVLAVLGFAGVVVNELARRFLTVRWARKAMLFQEWFDTALFGLQWNAIVGRKPREEDLRCWEKRFAGDASKKASWYIDVQGLPAGHAVLLCQRENLSWDARLRRIWGTALAAFAVCWGIAGVVIGVVGDWTVWQLVVRWLVPSGPVIMFAIQSGLDHHRIANEKDQLIDRVEDLLKAVHVQSTRGQKHLVALTREFQDHIAHLRREESRVPSWLYNLLRSDYEDEAASAAKRWRDQLVKDLAADRKMSGHR